MSEDFLSKKQLKPYSCGFVGPIDIESYDPLFDDNRPKYSVFVDYLSQSGYVYEPYFKKFYSYNPEFGIYDECDESCLRDLIYYLWKIKTNGNFNLMIKDVNSIIDQFKSTSKISDLDSLFSEFKKTHPEYELSEFLPVEGVFLNIPNKHKIVAFKNGLFNSEFEEILPHCRYNFVSIPYDHDFDLLSKEDLFESEIKDNYLSIFPDEDTLKYYIYWVGQLLFEDHPLPCFLNFVGRGSTGKSLVSSILCEILGKFRSSSVKLNDLLDKHGFAIVENKDLIVCNESESSKTATSIIKELIGQPTLTINPKNRPLREIDNHIRLIICGNRYLDIDATDSGIKRRIRVIRFRNYLDLEFGKYLYQNLSSKHGKDWLISCAYYCWLSSWNRNKTEEDLQSLSMKDEFNTMIQFDPLNDWLLSYCGALDKETVGNLLHKRNRKDVYEDFCAYCYDKLGDKPLKMVQWNKKMCVDYDLYSKNDSGFTYFSYRFANKT